MRRPVAGVIIGVTWVLAAAPGALEVAREASPAARGAVLAAWMIATALGIASAVQFRRPANHRRAGLLLLASGLMMPTSAMAWLKLVPIAYGGLVALRSPYSVVARYRP